MTVMSMLHVLGIPCHKLKGKTAFPSEQNCRQPVVSTLWECVTQSPVNVDLLQHRADGVLLDEGVPPQPPDNSFQGVWSWHDTIVWNDCSQYSRSQAPVVKGRVECPEWCGVQEQGTAAQCVLSPQKEFNSRQKHESCVLQLDVQPLVLLEIAVQQRQVHIQLCSKRKHQMAQREGGQGVRQSLQA